MSITPCEIAFDIDGVVADTFRVFVEKAREDYGYRFTYEDIVEYEFLEVLDMTKDDSDAIIQDLLENPIESGIQPIRGAVKVLTRLSGIAPLLFVTARPEKDPIIEWVYHQLPRVDRDLISLEATQTSGEKLPILSERGVKYFVEDRLDTCYRLKEISVTPIVFEQPWNKREHPFPVARGWDDISDMIIWPSRNE